MGYFEWLMIESSKLMDVFSNSPQESIDLFLSCNPSFEKVGKFAILAFIFEAEKESVFNLKVEENSEDWYSLLFKRLTEGIAQPDGYKEIPQNKISFVT
jgi:hypothetical protein